jgi:phosphatidylinositol alpha-1,6-mannosyltransferase
MARRHVELCRRLPPDEIVVSTVAATDGGVFDRGERYRIERQPFGFAQAKTIVNELRWARSIARRSASGIDVIHLGNIRPCGYAVDLARMWRPVSYVVYVNGGDLLREQIKTSASSSKRWSARRILGHARGIVANSTWTAALARDLMFATGVGTPPPVAAIDLGTDPAMFSPARDTGALRARLGLGDAPLIVTIARLVPHKGQDVGLDVLASLGEAYASVRYLIVGEGEDRPRLEARAGPWRRRPGDLHRRPPTPRSRSCATSCVYLGLAPRSGREREGLASFVGRRRAESRSSPAAREDPVGREMGDGIDRTPTSAAEAVGALRSLLGSRDRAAAMGAAGRRAVETHYNWDRVARETTAFVESVLPRVQH